MHLLKEVSITLWSYFSGWFMKIFGCFLMALLMIFFKLYAGNDNYPAGARSSSMAGASVTLQDVFSLQNNQAGLANLQKFSMGIYYEDKFLLPELSLRCIYITTPIKKYGVMGLSATQFGQRLYSESKIGLAYSVAVIDKLYVGVQLDYLNAYFPNSDYESKNMLAAEFGMLTYINSKLLLGLHVYNPTKTKLNNDEYIPTIYKLGANYGLSEKVTLCVEVEKNSQIEEVLFKAATEYKPLPILAFRTGINSQNQFSFGAGFVAKSFHINIAFTYKQVLGFTPALSLQYEF